MEMPQKLEIDTSFHLTILLLGITSKEKKSAHLKDTYIWMDVYHNPVQGS